jgi:hypothetical protein
MFSGHVLRRRRQPVPQAKARHNMATDHIAEPWAIRSTLIAVTELDRSLRFYREVGPFEEIVREGAVVVLRLVPAGSMFLILRETPSLHGVRHGQQSLGLRSLAFNVRTVGELDRIESMLRDHGRFTRRWKMPEAAAELVSGRDPDNLPLVFVFSDQSPGLEREYYRAIAGLVHSLDV